MLSVKNPNRVINTNPHYSEERFRIPITIFGVKKDGLTYKYSDELWRVDYWKAKKAANVAEENKIKPSTARWYQVFLSSYLGYDIEIHHILAGWNWNKGYSYLIFGYEDVVK